jgi:NAD(P)H-hydrate epimerase
MNDRSDNFPTLIYDAAAAGTLDGRFIDTFGVAGFTLMQRAAKAASSALAHRWPVPGKLAVLCGSGNNGGDGFLIARDALLTGWTVHLMCLADPADLQGDAARAASAFRAAGGEIGGFEDAPIQAGAVVDALLGTGVNRDVEGAFAQAISRINGAGEAGAGVLAVDIPSGLDANTGRVWARAVRADLTPTFITVKLGLLTGAGPGCCGELVFDALGAPEALYAGQSYAARRVGEAERVRWLPPRSADVHKGNNGHVLCAGGNVGMGGSIRMSAEAALRTGAGLVSVACHRDHAGAMSQARPELMCRPVDTGESIAALIAAADVIALGPGLGSDAWAEALWAEAIAAELPLVVDADALNRLAKQPKDRGNWVLTPHPGEAARLLDCAIAEVINDRPGTAREIARRYDAVAVLKGAGSLIATAEGDLWVCAAGNPGMAVGGMGDALTGVIAALIGQGLPAGEAAALGVYVHARAGDDAAAQAGQRGLLPSDLIACLRTQVNP